MISKIYSYRIVCLLIILLIFTSTCFAISDKQKYFADSVLAAAYKTKEINGLPASIVAAQCILESGWGKHTPHDWKTGERSNNFFGIKSDGTQPYVRSWTYEWENGKYYRVLAKFRKYDTFVESLIDYGNFIYENPRYKKAIKVKDNPIKYIYEIWKAGYATGRRYAEKVIWIAELCEFLSREKWEVK